MGYTIDYKLLWDVLVTAGALVGCFGTWLAWKFRREGASEVLDKQAVDRLEKAEAKLQKAELDINATQVLGKGFGEDLVALDSRVCKLEGGVKAHDSAIGTLREEVARLPSREELRSLHAELSGVRVSIGEVMGQLRGVSNTLNTINQHLINGGSV